MSRNLFDYYKSKEWKQTDLERVSLNGVYEFRRREQERYESIFGLIENKEKNLINYMSKGMKKNAMNFT